MTIEARVLAAVEQHNRGTGFPATNADVCESMGWASRSTSHWYLRSLHRQGLVVLRGRQGYVVAGLGYERSAA